MSESLPVVVLSAGRMPAGLAEATGVSATGLAPIAGKPLIDYVLAAIDATDRLGPVAVVCAEGSGLAEHVGERAVKARGPSIVDSLLTGFEALGNPDRALIVTGDLPMLTPESLDHLCSQVLPHDAGIVYSIVARDDCERMFPHGRRTYFRLREGVFTGGNISLMTRDFVQNHGQQLQAAYALRKNPLKLCTLLGWVFVFRFVLGCVSLPEILDRGGRVLGAPVAAVVSPYPQIGFDVDKPEQLVIVEKMLAQDAGPNA